MTMVAATLVSGIAQATPKADCDGQYASDANDHAICVTYNAGVDAFDARGTKGVFDGEYTTLGAVEGKAHDANLNYDILIIEARMAYWQGEHTSDNNQKKTIHLLGVNKSKAATQISDDYAEGYYYAGINLARWAEANGILSSLGRKGELESDMKAAQDRTSRTGDDGASIDGYGADRVLGRENYKLKMLPGYSLGSSIQHLSDAVAKSNPPVALNTVYLADSLLKSNAADKARAHQILTDLVANDVNKYNPDRAPETADEFKLANDLLAGREIP
jgi:hypothetical protein